MFSILIFKMNLFNKLINQHLIIYPTSKNLNFIYAIGSILSFLLVIQIITGFIMTFYYIPFDTQAFDTVEIITNKFSYGYLLRFLHITIATFLFIFLYLHLGKNIYNRFCIFYSKKLYLLKKKLIIIDKILILRKFQQYIFISIFIFFFLNFFIQIIIVLLTRIIDIQIEFLYFFFEIILNINIITFKNIIFFIFSVLLLFLNIFFKNLIVSFLINIFNKIKIKLYQFILLQKKNREKSLFFILLKTISYYYQESKNPKKTENEYLYAIFIWLIFFSLIFAIIIITVICLKILYLYFVIIINLDSYTFFYKGLTLFFTGGFFIKLFFLLYLNVNLYFFWKCIIKSNLYVSPVFADNEDPMEFWKNHKTPKNFKIHFKIKKLLTTQSLVEGLPFRYVIGGYKFHNNILDRNNFFLLNTFLGYIYDIFFYALPFWPLKWIYFIIMSWLHKKLMFSHRLEMPNFFYTFTESVIAHVSDSEELGWSINEIMLTHTLIQKSKFNKHLKLLITIIIILNCFLIFFIWIFKFQILFTNPKTIFTFVPKNWIIIKHTKYKSLHWTIIYASFLKTDLTRNDYYYQGIPLSVFKAHPLCTINFQRTWAEILWKYPDQVGAIFSTQSTVPIYKIKNNIIQLSYNKILTPVSQYLIVKDKWGNLVKKTQFVNFPIKNLLDFIGIKKRFMNEEEIQRMWKYLIEPIWTIFPTLN